jgi:hypothetical protein
VQVAASDKFVRNQQLLSFFDEKVGPAAGAPQRLSGVKHECSLCDATHSLNAPKQNPDPTGRYARRVEPAAVVNIFLAYSQIVIEEWIQASRSFSSNGLLR